MKKRLTVLILLIVALALLLFMAASLVIIYILLPNGTLGEYLWPAFGSLLGIIVLAVAVLLLLVPRVSNAVLAPISTIKEKLAAIGKPEERKITLTPYDEINQVLVEIDEMSDEIDKNLTAAVRLKKEKQDFFANASHELNTPLSAIVGYAEIMENEQKFVPEFASAIHSQALRMKALIGDMLRLSQLDEGTTFIDEEINLQSVATDVLTAYSPKAASKNISLEANLIKVFMNADKEKITELISNLVDNAIKYTDEGGEVFVGLTKQNGRTVISVKDNGIGIAEKHLARIFERFYRTDKSRSRAEGGTGLGLAIVKHIATHYNAAVTVKSTEGKGTEVVVTF